MEWVAIAVAVLALALVVRALIDLRAPGLDKLTKRRVVVHTKDDQSIRGILVAVHHDSLQLTGVEYLEKAREEAQGIPGEAMVLRSNVSWLQVLGD